MGRARHDAIKSLTELKGDVNFATAAGHGAGRGAGTTRHALACASIVKYIRDKTLGPGGELLREQAEKRQERVTPNEVTRSTSRGDAFLSVSLKLLPFFVDSLKSSTYHHGPRWCPIRHFRCSETRAYVMSRVSRSTDKLAKNGGPVSCS